MVTVPDRLSPHLESHLRYLQEGRTKGDVLMPEECPDCKALWDAGIRHEDVGKRIGPLGYAAFGGERGRW